MNTVRFFGRLIDPADYRRGFGASGFFIWLLNWFRLRLERRVVMLILSVELRKAGAKGEVLKKALQSAEEDPAIRPEMFHPDVVAARKRLPRDVVAPLYATREEKTEGRYREGRKNASEVRPVPLTEGAFPSLFAQAQQHQDRSMRYYFGRGSTIRSLVEDFEEVTDGVARGTRESSDRTTERTTERGAGTGRTSSGSRSQRPARRGLRHGGEPSRTDGDGSSQDS